MPGCKSRPREGTHLPVQATMHKPDLDHNHLHCLLVFLPENIIIHALTRPRSTSLKTQNYFSSSFVSCSRKSPAANTSHRDRTQNSDAGVCLHGAHQLHPAVQGLQRITLKFNLKLSSSHPSQFSWVQTDTHQDCVRWGSGSTDFFSGQARFLRSLSPH